MIKPRLLKKENSRRTKLGEVKLRMREGEREFE